MTGKTLIPRERLDSGTEEGYIRGNIQELIPFIARTISLRTGWIVEQRWDDTHTYRLPEYQEPFLTLTVDVHTNAIVIGIPHMAGSARVPLPPPTRSYAEDVTTIAAGVYSRIMNGVFKHEQPLDGINLGRSIFLPSTEKVVTPSASSLTYPVNTIINGASRKVGILTVTTDTISFTYADTVSPQGKKFTNSQATLPSTPFELGLILTEVNQWNHDTFQYEDVIPIINANDIASKLTTATRKIVQETRQREANRENITFERRDRLVRNFITLECDPTSVIEYPRYDAYISEDFVRALIAMLGAEELWEHDALGYLELVDAAETEWSKLRDTLERRNTAPHEQDTKITRMVSLLSDQGSTGGERTNSYSRIQRVASPCGPSEDLTPEATALVHAARSWFISELDQRPYEPGNWATAPIGTWLGAITFPKPQLALTTPTRKQLTPAQLALPPVPRTGQKKRWWKRSH